MMMEGGEIDREGRRGRTREEEDGRGMMEGV